MYRVNQYPPPPPQRGSKAVLIAGIVCLGLSAILGGAVFLLARRHRLPAAALAPSASASSAAPRSVAGSVAGSDPPVVVEDDPVAAPGTPPSSLKARPPWGAGTFNSHAGPTKQYAPQLSVPLDVFIAATPLSGDVERGFVICRFQTFGHADSFSGDDLHVRATFGATPEVANDGPEDANLGFVSAPLVTLKNNDSVRFEVYDRDVTELESITHPTHKYDGKALSITDTGANIECKTLPADALKRITSEHSAAADMALAALKAKKLDASEPDDWGWPSVGLLSVQQKIEDVAALVGWDDARARSRVASFDATTASLEADRKGVFDALYAKTTDDGIASGVHLHFVELLCGAKKLAAPGRVSSSGAACLAHLTLANETTAAFKLGRWGGDCSHLVTEAGPAYVTLYDAAGTETTDLSVPGSATIDIYLAPNQKMDGPTLANVCVGRQCAWVKVK